MAEPIPNHCKAPLGCMLSFSVTDVELRHRSMMRDTSTIVYSYALYPRSPVRRRIRLCCCFVATSSRKAPCLSFPCAHTRKGTPYDTRNDEAGCAHPLRHTDSSVLTAQWSRRLRRPLTSTSDSLLHHSSCHKAYGCTVNRRPSTNGHSVNTTQGLDLDECLVQLFLDELCFSRGEGRRQLQ